MKVEKTARKRKAVDVLLILLTVCAFLVAISMVSQRMSGKKQAMVLGWGAAYVLTGSMEPTVPVGSLILIHEQDEYEVGDIVTYAIGDRTPITHRIIAVQGDVIETQGDANNSKDPPFDKSQICGKVVWWAPGLGEMVSSLQSPVVFGVCAVAIGLIWLFPYNKKVRKVEDVNVREENGCA